MTTNDLDLTSLKWTQHLSSMPLLPIPSTNPVDATQKSISNPSSSSHLPAFTLANTFIISCLQDCNSSLLFFNCPLCPNPIHSLNFSQNGQYKPNHATSYRLPHAWVNAEILLCILIKPLHDLIPEYFQPQISLSYVSSARGNLIDIRASAYIVPQPETLSYQLFTWKTIS